MTADCFAAVADTVYNMEKMTTYKLNTNAKKLIFVWLMLLPAIVGFLVFYVYINFNSVLMAFEHEDYWTGKVGYDLENFKMFFKEIQNPESFFWIALKNNLKMFFCSVVLVLPLSVVLCYAIYKKVAMYKTFRFIIYLPVIVMPTVTVMLFKYVISREGPVDLLFNMFGGHIPDLLANPKTAMNTVLFYLVFFSLGGNVVLVGGAMNSIEPSVIDAGQIDGVDKFVELTKLVVPMIWPTLSVLFLMSSVVILSSSGPILLFTKGNYDTWTIGYWIYQQVLDGVRFNYASAIGLICTAVSLPFALLVKRLIGIIDKKWSVS